MSIDHEIADEASREPYGSLALNDDPKMAFPGIQALRDLADFCKAYQMRRWREAGHTWAEIARWAKVTPQALHKRHAQSVGVSQGPGAP
jgi:hypothetical protein